MLPAGNELVVNTEMEILPHSTVKLSHRSSDRRVHRRSGARALLGAECPALAMAEEPKPQEAAAADAGALHPLQWPPLGPVRHPRPEASPQQYCNTPPPPPFPAPLPKQPWMGMFMC